MESMPITEVDSHLTTARRVTSQSSEIVHELSRKIKNIKTLLSTFKDRLSLDLGEEGFAAKILYLDLLIKFIKELGIPFVCQINDSGFLRVLESCYNKHFEIKKRIDEIIALVGYAVGFDKDNLSMAEYFKFVERIDPDFKWIARRPAGDFENTVHEALMILRLCKDTNEALMKPPSKKFNREEKISEAIKASETLQSSPDLFKPGFKPIELEFIDDIILHINQFEKDFLSMSKKAQKNFEKTLLQKKHPQKSQVPKKFESEQKLHKRTYFVYNENLIEDEGDCIEYKNYRYPFNEMIERTLQKTICSFLNQKGGRIYIGVDDYQKMVCGLTLTSKDRDSLKMEVYHMLNDFYPAITHKSFVKVVFLPVRDNTNNTIPGRVVVKIIVKPGARDQIYSVTKSSLKCFIRGDGFCKNLDADQTVSLLRDKWSQSMDKKIDLKEFDDPPPAMLAEIEYESAAKKQTKQSWAINQTENRKEEDKKQEVSSNEKLAHQSNSNNQVVKIKLEKNNLEELLDGVKKNHRVTYGFKLTCLPTDTTEEEILSLFPGVKLASKPKVIRDKEGKCIGLAFINFYDLETGKKLAEGIHKKKILRNNTLKMVVQPIIDPSSFPTNVLILHYWSRLDHRVTYGFKLTCLPTDTTKEEIVSLFRGVNLASEPTVIRDKEGKCIGRAYINFYDLETGNNEVQKINIGQKKLRSNTLNMVFQTNSYGFKLTCLPTDTTKEEIVSLFRGVNLASEPTVIRDKKGKIGLAYINFYDLETGNNESKKINNGEKKLRNKTLNMVFQIKPSGFRLTGLPTDTTEEEIVSLFRGVNLASEANVIRDKEGKCIGRAYINFYDLETGNNEARKINIGQKKLRSNTLRMVAQENQ